VGAAVARVGKRSARRVQTDALVVRSVAYGEADIIATLLTEQEGKVSAIVRGARRGSRRVAGALEPVHTIRVLYEDKGTDLVTLKEAQVIRARPGLVSRLEAIEAAGTALRWARHVCPPKTPEPALWASLRELLDGLDSGVADPRTELAIFGLRLLGDVGWGLELERCVICGKPCPEDAAAMLDAQRGGLVCRACGGARTLLPAAVKRAAIEATRGGDRPAIAAQANALIELVESAMAAHAGFER